MKIQWGGLTAEKFNGTATLKALALLLFAGGSAFGLPSGASARVTQGEDGNEIIVTVNKRPENLREIPGSVSVFSSRMITDQNILQISHLNSLAPGLRVQNADVSANPKIYIRGVGLGDFNPNASSAVSVYVDGVYQASQLTQMTGFYDLERVEVMQGPQGTLYGRNTTAGAINVISRRPVWEREGYVNAEYGSFNAVKIESALNQPLIANTLSLRVAGQLVRDDGTTVNTIDSQRVNNADRWGTRAQLLFTPGPSQEYLAEVHYFQNRAGTRQPVHRSLRTTVPAATGPDGGCIPEFWYTASCTDAYGFSAAGTDLYQISADVVAPDAVTERGGSLQATWRLNGLSLISLTALDTVRHNSAENSDASAGQLLTSYNTNSHHQVSQELRLQSGEQGDGRVTWVAGLFYMDDTLNNDSSSDIFRQRRPSFMTPSNPTGVSLANAVALYYYPYVASNKTYGVFAQVDYNLTPRLRVTAGARWSGDEKDMDYTLAAEDRSQVLFHFTGKKTFEAPTARLAVRYTTDTFGMLYASYNRGYKAGGFFGGFTRSVSQLQPYQNEYVDAYEIGLKSSFLERRANLAVAVFDSRFTDMQVFSLVNQGGFTVQILNNAGSAFSRGVDVDFNVRLLNGLRLATGIEYLDARYEDYVSAGADYSGNVTPQAPKWSFNGSISYPVKLAGGSSITPRVDASYRSKIFYDNANTLRLSDAPMWLWNVQVNWLSSAADLEAGLWIRNLFDKHWAINMSPLGSFGHDDISMASPRTVGVSIRKRW